MSTSTSTSISNHLHISTHPLVAAKLTQLRLHDLPPKDFRDGIRAIGSMMIYEASRDVQLVDVPEVGCSFSFFISSPASISHLPIVSWSDITFRIQHSLSKS